MPEEHQSLVDVVLGEVADVVQVCLCSAAAERQISVSRTTEQCVDDVLGRRVGVCDQQVLARYRSRRTCNRIHHFCPI